MAQGTFHIITFGCQMNVNDSFWLARSLQRRGFVESPLEKAEVVILNTCSVRDKPEQKVYAALGRIKYETRRVPGSFAVVAGCVAQQIGAGFFERFPQVRLVVGGDGLAMAPEAIERRSFPAPEPHRFFRNLPRTRPRPARARRRRDPTSGLRQHHAGV